jgi:ASCH domain
MKAISIKQPWAELIASGRKTIELRSWSRDYRGELVIVSGLRFDPRGAHYDVDGPRGVAVCVVDLVDVRPATFGDSEAACFGVDVDEFVRADKQLFSWVLANPRRVAPTPVRGVLGLFSVALPPG